MERVEEDSLAMRVAMGLLDFYKREISRGVAEELSLRADVFRIRETSV